MNSKPLITRKALNVGTTQVWAALTEPERMKSWYFDLNGFKPEVGFEFSFYGCDEDGVKYLHNCKVLEVTPGKKLVHTWCYDGMPGYSVVAIELTGNGDTTDLVLTHTGIETFDQTRPSFARESFREGWAEIIGKSLPEYLAKQA